MGFIIISEDVTTGTIYDGTWTLSRPVVGHFKLISQYIYPQDIYWMWSANNVIKFRFTKGVDTFNCTVTLPTTYTNTNQFQDISESWGTAIQTELDALAPDVNVEVHLLDQDTYYDLSFTGDMDFTTILWEDPACTSAPVFDKQTNETDLNSEFAINYTQAMQTVPEFLECKIEESTSETLTTHDSVTNLIFKTTGEFISGQTINFRVATQTLTIKFYRTGDNTNPVYLQHNWHLFFQ